MIGPGGKQYQGQLRLSGPTDTTCADDDTYYKIEGDFVDGALCGFTVSGDKLIYHGSSGVPFLFNGSSDLQVNKACNISYALFRNGHIVPRAETPHTFTSPSKTSNISITAIIELMQGDEFEVFAKSSEANTVLSIHTLNITLWGKS